MNGAKICIHFVFYGSQVIKNVTVLCSWTSRAANLWSSAKACGKWLWNE